MRKAIAIFFTLTFLAGNIGFALGTHYCGGHAMESKVVLGKANLDCGMGMMEPTNSHSIDMKNMGCCKDVFQQLKVNDDFNSVVEQQSPHAQFALLFVITYADLFTSYQQPSLTFVDYTPPPLDRDVPSLYQVFLI